MATNKFAYSTAAIQADTDTIGERQSIMPGSILSNLTIKTGSTKANTKTLIYSINTPSYLALTAYLDVAASGGQIWIHAGADEGSPLIMYCVFSGGECKVPIPTLLFSPQGWAIYAQGDGTNYLNVSYQISLVGGSLSQILYPAGDTYLNEAYETTNYGNAATIQLRNTGAGSDCHSLMKFDLSALAGAATINMASLSLKSGSTRLVTDWRIHAMLVDWVDLEATWNIRKTGVNWGAAGMQAGVDYRTVPNWQGNISITANVRYTFDLTSLVQEWINGTLTNNGICMYFGTVDGLNVVTPSSVQAADAKDRPILSVSAS